MANTRSPRLAVLIDADNTSPKVVEGLFLEVAKLGEASVRRIYGDFTENRMRGWADVLPAYAIVPHQQFAYTQGKNSADIALVIDAMDLLHSGRIEGFCLVSSDSDFARLAARIREQGIDAYGFGQRKTPLSFRQACKRFFFIENLMAEPAVPAAARPPAPDIAAPSVSPPPEPETAPPASEPPEKAVPLIRNAMTGQADDDGWIDLGQLGNQMQKLAPDFDTRTYGSGKLSSLIERTGLFEIDKTARPMRLRLRPPAVPAKRRRITRPAPAP